MAKPMDGANGDPAADGVAAEVAALREYTALLQDDVIALHANMLEYHGYLTNAGGVAVALPKPRELRSVHGIPPAPPAGRPADWP